MLKRIQKISNIGRFSDCRVPGCVFGEETIVFGYNTQGKSTLTAILRSLQTGNNDILIGRKTFGATSAKNVEFDFDNSGVADKFIFQNRAWNKINPNILIFDSKFIAENVFDGESITFDHQKNLNTVIIGKKGQELNSLINDLQKQSDAFAVQKTDKTREFARHFPSLDLVKFKAIPKDTDIEDKIKNKDKEIKFELEKEVIKKLVRSHIASLSAVRFSVKEILIKTMDVKQEEIENHIKNHFTKKQNAQNFLSEGLDFLKDKPADGSARQCVFCGQELNQDSEHLISIYASFFKGGYEDLVREVAGAVDYFKSVNIEAALEKITGDLKSKDLDVSLGDERVESIVRLKKGFEEELDKKRDLNYSINFAAFDSFKDEIEGIRRDLEELEQKKLNIPSPKTILQLEAERKTLDLVKRRHDPAWVKFCNDYDALDKEAEQVRATREEKRKELETHSLAVFGTHKGTINSLCRDLGADFEIEDFKPLKKIVGKSERIFAIKFFGTHKIGIDTEDEKTPNFRNTLSESDKRLLAFAFFVSLLMHDKELGNKIIVLDDPMSSFDNERRRKTIHHVADIACKYKDATGALVTVLPKQKIVLTHEDRFAKELKRLMPKAVTLKIESYMDGANKRSKISHADFSEDFPEDDITHRIEKVKNILDTGSFSAPFTDDCRIVLEHIFKRKYYLDLKLAISQRKSIRTFTTTLSAAKIGGFEDEIKNKKFIRLCDDLNIELHDNDADNSNGDKESIIKDFFDCLSIL